MEKMVEFLIAGRNHFAAYTQHPPAQQSVACVESEMYNSQRTVYHQAAQKKMDRHHELYGLSANFYDAGLVEHCLPLCCSHIIGTSLSIIFHSPQKHIYYYKNNDRTICMHIVAKAMTIELEMYTFLLYFCIFYPRNFSHLLGRTIQIKMTFIICHIRIGTTSSNDCDMTT